MIAHIRDLFAHQQWADAEMWNAVAKSPAALSDPRIGKRFRHFHATQYGYLGLLRDGTSDIRQIVARYGDSLEMMEVKRSAIGTHREFEEYLATLDNDQLGEKILIPWFKDPTFIVTRGDALLQVVLHSQHHRGQNATTLRELGDDPPTLDFVLWVWKGKPAPSW